MDRISLTRALRVAAILGCTGVPTVALAIWIGVKAGFLQSAAPKPLAAQTLETSSAWDRLTDSAGFPPGYNFPVFVAAGRFNLLHPAGTWTSRDGSRWERGHLPFSGLNSAYLKFVEHNGAVWSLGTLNGNYLGFSVNPVITRTTDFESWQTIGRSTTLPQLVFYGATSFRGAMWLIGGYNAHGEETSEVWRSADGVTWDRVAAKAPWSARANPGVIVFRDRLYVIGGAQIDGPQANDVWSSTDGVNWRLEADRMTADGRGGTLIVFNNRLWQVGAHRNGGGFASAVLVSDDAKTWHYRSAPWSPRGGVAVWARNDSLFMTGGKYSTVRTNEHVFTYSNDVWVMTGTK